MKSVTVQIPNVFDDAQWKLCASNREARKILADKYREWRRSGHVGRDYARFYYLQNKHFAHLLLYGMSNV